MVIMKTLLSVFTLFALGAPSVHTQDIDDTMRRHILRGLKQVVVGVATHEKLESADFKAAAELRLRTAGVPVGSDIKAPLTDSSTPLLLFNISTLTGLASVWVVETALMQAVCLRRDMSVCTISDTWNANGEFGFGPVASIHDKLLEVVRKDADQFANAFLAANAKQ
jgi:hypothetical protein